MKNTEEKLSQLLNDHVEESPSQTIGDEEARKIAAENHARWSAEWEAKIAARTTADLLDAGVPQRYAKPWTRPTDETWSSSLDRIKTQVEEGGIIALIGQRGTGKTRMACELIRDSQDKRRVYVRAMDLFLRLRAVYQGRPRTHRSRGRLFDGPIKADTEDSIVREMIRANLLVIDEIQVRGETDFEDRILTHIIDERYGEMLPTVLIANLKCDELAENLGSSICDRMHEGGGVIEMTGESHRRTKP